MGDHVYFRDEAMVPKRMRLDGSGLMVMPGYSAQIEPEMEDDSVERSELQTFGEGSVTVYVTSGELMAAYKLFRVDEDGELTEAVSCVLQPHAQADLYVEPGTYVLKTAEGAAWISNEEAFGPTGIYSKTEPTELLSGYQYSISSGPQGDFYGDTAAGFANP